MPTDFLGLDQFCKVISDGDILNIEPRRREFVSLNWSMINALDRLANAYYSADQFERAADKYALLEELVPESTWFFLRRVSSAVRAGDLSPLNELASAANRLRNDNELFHAVEELVGNGRPELASSLINDCEALGHVSPGIIAASKSRVLDTVGLVHDAISTLDTELASERPNVIAMRCRYLLLEKLLDLHAAAKLCCRTALLWGAERDLQHAFARFTFIYDFKSIGDLLSEFKNHFPEFEPLVAKLTAKADELKTEADAARTLHGATSPQPPKDIFDILSKPGTSASLVRWGKQSLVELLYSGRMTEADYTMFAWFLPNWEEGLIREHVLSAARAQLPDAPSVQRGWLHHLVARGAYGDAARFCEILLGQDIDEDVLFLAIALLRLEKDGVVASFMDQRLFESVRTQLITRARSAGPDFRCVMHDHIVALGGAPESWPIRELASSEALSSRRLFAITTGRLNRVSAYSPTVRTPAICPVLAISGQLRGFETAWSSIHHHLCQPTGAPVILTVWDKSVNATGRHARRLERALPADIIAKLKPEERYTDTFEQAYPKTYNLLFGQTDVDATSLHALVAASSCKILAVETESEDMLSHALPPHVSPNMLKMYYKFARVEQLIQAEEEASGAMFSHVIWSRPDCQIVRLAPADLAACLAKPGIAWSSFTTETSFGDYVMVVPRKAFRTLAAIFPRVVTGGDTFLMPWRPNRSSDPRQRTNLDAFGGPDVIFDILLAAGYNPLARIPRMALNLLGRTPGSDVVRSTFDTERQKKMTSFIE